MSVISGIQQIGIGITDVYESYAWYKENLGFNVPIIDASGWAELMLPYTAGQPQKRHAIMALNMQGGGGLEIWQYVNRKPTAPEFEPEIGDLGIYITKIKCGNIEKAYNSLTKKGVQCGDLYKSPAGRPVFYFKDPSGNIFQMIESNVLFKKTRYDNGGVYGATIGVSDMSRSLEFYVNVLGYDETVYDTTGVFEDYINLPGGDQPVRRVLLTHKNRRKGAFSNLLGQTEIELISLTQSEGRKIFKNRLWGDLGFIHLCFDIINMDEMKLVCGRNGYEFTVDSASGVSTQNKSFDMGQGAGRFAYVEDPDGTLIEFVETHKIPVMQKFGWYIDLTKRDPYKPLPNFMLKMLDFGK